MDTPEHSRHRGRRPGKADTRNKIVEAARVVFADAGYAGASMRAVARQAGVDPTLVHHYFDTKAELFVDSIAAPLRDAADWFATIIDHIGDQPSEFGANTVRTFFEQWDDVQGDTGQARCRDFRIAAQGIITNDAALAEIRDFLMKQVSELAAASQHPDAALRTELIIGQLLGLGITRYVLRLPAMADANPEALINRIGPIVQAFASQ